MEREFIPIKVAVMLVSDAPSTLDEATGKLVVDKLAEAGHDVWPIEVVKDSEVAVRKQMDSWIDFSDVDVIIAISGFETDSTNIALAPLITKQLMGFSDLFRLLTYREIGTAAMLTEVIAAQCGHVFVFALPAARGAVATALEKLLIPQLDCRTRPRNLVMKMMRHKSKVPTTGPMSFPPTENTPFGVPPPPRSSNGRTAPPPPPKRNPTTHSTPPLPIVAVAPPVVSRTISDPNITELDPNAVIEEAVSNPAITPPPLDAMAEAIERSIESSASELDDDFKQAQGTPPPPLDDNDPAVIAAREHASKSPEAQAAAWVAAVEEAASKAIKKTAAERAEREARRSGEHRVPDVSELEAAADETPAAAAKPEEPEPEEAKVEAKPEPKPEKKVEPAEEPRGKIEKATGAKAAPKPDRPVDNVAAVIVDDPELVEKRARAASIKPATTLEPPPPVARAVEASDLPVFPARHATPAPPKSNRGWMMVGGLAVVGAIVLLIAAMGKRDTSASPGDRKDPAPTQPDLASTPPVDPPDTGNTAGVLIGDPPPADAADVSADIEMEPQNARKPAGGSSEPVRPKPPREPKEPREPVNPDDPDLTKAPANPITADECDEVTCILNKFNKPCCERYKPKDAPPPPVENPNPTNPNPSGGPVELDKTLIRIGVERFRAQIIRCGEQSAAKGTVSLSVSVKPDGTVGSISVSATPDAALGECAANVMRKATFAKTQNGGSFTYPFVF